MGKHSGKMIHVEDRELSPIENESADYVQMTLGDFASDADYEDGYEKSDAERWGEQQRRSRKQVNQQDDVNLHQNHMAVVDYNNLSKKEAALLSDSELCAAYDKAMIDKDEKYDGFGL